MGPYGMGFPTDEVANNGWRLYILSVVMIISAGLFVVARIATRISVSQLGWDDAAVVGSLLMSLMVSICMQLAIENGYGMHKADLDTDQLRLALKLFFFAQTPYKISVCLNKVAAILFCLRIFISQNFRIAAFIVMGIIVAWSIGGVGATIWQCVPIAGAWNKSLGARCINSDRFWVAYAVMNVLTDVMVLVLPLPSVLRLQLKLREKLLLCGIFLMGGFVTITSILRTTSVQNSLRNREDITFNFIDRGIWTLLEINLGIISACLPVLKQPLARMFPRIFGSRVGTYGANTNRSQPLASMDRGGVFALDKLVHLQKQNEFTVSATGGHQQYVGRTSDEQGIISASKSSDIDVDGSDLPPKNTILKRVEVSRTSFQTDRT